MKPQIWIGNEPISEMVEPIENQEHRGDKPCGGIWTSSETTEASSEWIEWCRRENWWNGSETNLWRLWPIEDVDVLKVVTMDDLSEWFYYPRDSFRYQFIDWEAIFQEYEAVHLTSEGARNTHFPVGGKPDLNTWDVESTLWRDWLFEDRELIGDI